MPVKCAGDAEEAEKKPVKWVGDAEEAEKKPVKWVGDAEEAGNMPVNDNDTPEETVVSAAITTS